MSQEESPKGENRGGYGFEWDIGGADVVTWKIVGELLGERSQLITIDLGCANARRGGPFTCAVATITGATQGAYWGIDKGHSDLYPGVADNFAKKKIEWNLLHGDIMSNEVSLPDCNDLAFMVEVVHWFTRDEAKEIFARLRENMKPNGFLVLTAGTPANPLLIGGPGDSRPNEYTPFARMVGDRAMVQNSEVGIPVMDQTTGELLGCYVVEDFTDSRHLSPEPVPPSEFYNHDVTHPFCPHTLPSIALVLLEAGWMLEGWVYAKPSVFVDGSELPGSLRIIAKPMSDEEFEENLKNLDGKRLEVLKEHFLSMSNVFLENANNSSV